jgi:flagellin-like protein
MIHKKGVSPLIATVLLIAFAVALGSVVLNIGVSLAVNPCDTSKVIIASQGNVCYDGSTIRFRVLNEGTSSVDGFKVSIVGETDSLNQEFDTPLGTGDQKPLTIVATQLKKVVAVSVFPVVNDRGVKTVCVKQKFETTLIGSC